MAIARSLGRDTAARWHAATRILPHELSDTDLVELWLNVADPDQPTAEELAVRDELSRREIHV